MTEDRIEALVDAMTLEERVSLLAGASSWQTVPIERLGVPAIKVTDGPNGARGGGALVGGVEAACFPAGIALGASWNTALVAEVGAALAEEAHSKGARVLLAPTVNIHRSPLNGRNFECYSEDPYLSAQLAKAFIAGVQSRGVAATVKHFVGNESEFERMTISSELDERPLREIYLVPFETAVNEARVWAVMTAYNKVNGTYAGEHPRLLRDVLKTEWGFDGVAMSDWFGTHSTAEALNAGLDLEMPGPTRHRGQALVEAVRTGAASAETVADGARRMLRLLTRVGAFDDPEIRAEQALDRPEHRALIRRAGAEGIVLLANTGLLPLDPNGVGTVAVIGPNAKTAQIMGGGSAQVNAHYRVSPLDGIAARLGDAARVRYEPGCTNERLLPLLRDDVTLSYYDSLDMSGEAVASECVAGTERMWLDEVAPGIDPARFSARLEARFTPTEDGDHLVGLVSAGPSRLLVDGELVLDNWQGWRAGQNYFGMANDELRTALPLRAGRTYDLTVEYAAPSAAGLNVKVVRLGVTKPLADEAIERAVEAAAAADVALLCVGLNGEWDTEGQDRPHLELVGRQDELIARVAAANPRTIVVLQTGAPVTMPWLPQVAAVLQAWYPGQECGNAIADVLFGAVDPSGRLPQTFPVRLEDNPTFIHYPGENGRVRYGEGLFVGYRYYDAKRLAPLFPFGFGLSYTTFAYGDLRLSSDTSTPGDELTATLDLTNTGARAGHEVVQLYVRDPQARLARPEKELKAFAKVRLEPGATTTVSLTLGMRALAYYDDAQAAWVADAGTFEVLVGASVDDIRARADFVLTADWRQPSDPQGGGGR